MPYSCGTQCGNDNIDQPDPTGRASALYESRIPFRRHMSKEVETAFLSLRCIPHFDSMLM